MKLSVCLFAYNHEAFLTEAFKGILNQETDFDFEIIVGEDCSKDDTRSIIRKYKKVYPDKINADFNKTNIGLMENNIKTMLRCKGEYIALLDGDDFWIEKKKLQKQVEFLDKNPAYSFCFHDANILNFNGSYNKKTCCQSLKKSDIEFEDLIFNVSVPTCSIVFRREAIKDFPPKWFKDLHAPDRPLNLLLANWGKGYFIKECWGTYRLHPNGSWTGRSYEHRWLTFLQIFKVVNHHFDGKYFKQFSFHQNQIYYRLASQLLENEKYKRASTFFKRFVSTNNDKNWLKITFYFRVIYFRICFFYKWLTRKTEFTHFNK